MLCIMKFIIPPPFTTLIPIESNIDFTLFKAKVGIGISNTFET